MKTITNAYPVQLLLLSFFKRAHSIRELISFSFYFTMKRNNLSIMETNMFALLLVGAKSTTCTSEYMLLFVLVVERERGSLFLFLF